MIALGLGPAWAVPGGLYEDNILKILVTDKALAIYSWARRPCTDEEVTRDNSNGTPFPGKYLYTGAHWERNLQKALPLALNLYVSGFGDFGPAQPAQCIKYLGPAPTNLEPIWTVKGYWFPC